MPKLNDKEGNRVIDDSKRLLEVKEVHNANPNSGGWSNMDYDNKYDPEHNLISSYLKIADWIAAFFREERANNCSNFKEYLKSRWGEVKFKSISDEEYANLTPLQAEFILW